MAARDGHVAWYQVTEGRISSFEVIVSFFFRNIAGFAVVVLFLGTQMRPSLRKTLGHQGQFGLVVSANRDTGGVDLCVAGVTKVSTFAVCFPGSGYVATHGIGGKVEYVAITTGT